MNPLFDLPREMAPHLLGGLHLLLALIASSHALLHTTDSRAAAGWVGIIWLSPVFGAVAYLLFGINRIRRRAARLRRDDALDVRVGTGTSTVEEVVARSPPLLDRFVGNVTGRPLLPGNRLTPLHGGAEAYPAMCAAIDAAKETVALCSYIFNLDSAGRPFVDALARAVDRGVEVRVLVDDVGARYSFPSCTRALRRRGVPTARFLPTLLPTLMPYVNLRNHRKLLIVDGREAFTGGINISEGNLPAALPRRPVQDLHFRVQGPVSAQLLDCFAEDWAFTTGEELDDRLWFPTLEPGTGSSGLARAVSAGPDDDLNKLHWTVLGAVSRAQRSVRVRTPYFVPDAAILDALSVAAMCGVEVEIHVPERTNHMLVQWASHAVFEHVINRGCRVYATPPPFDHSKLLVVDDAWFLIGSMNWDARSFRLNFELGVECHDVAMAGTLAALFAERRVRARELTKASLAARGIPTRVRDGLARLFSPYL